MPITLHEPSAQPWRRRLYLPAYRVGDAARYAGTRPRRAAYWHFRDRGDGPLLEGRERRRPLSYLELVELAFVATFRELGVTVPRIRRARDYLAQRFQFEYPFAELRLMTNGQHVLMDLQRVDPGADVEQLIVADEHGQLAWRSVVSDRFRQFDYEDGIAIRWHLAGRESSVVIDPRVSFGAPAVRGIPTWAVKGRRQAGETLEEIEADFHLKAKEVRQALKFEGLPDAT